MDINQDNLIEKLQLLKLLIQKGRFEIGVSDDVNELDEFVDGESMGILALVDNKEARLNRSFLEKYILNHCIDDTSITRITKLTILNLTIGCIQENGSANIKKNQNNNIEINSILIINNKENINSNGKNKNISNNSENIRNKINSHTIVKEEININESVIVGSIINRINKSITSGLVKEINIIDSNNSKVDNIQITSNANKNEQFIKKNYSVNNITNIKERKINNNNSPVDFSNIINVDSDKEIKIEKIKKKIKITHIFIQNNVNKKWALTLKVHNSSNRRDGGLKIAKRKIISSSYEVSKPPRCRDIYI
ncbi:hypothetical protein H8356DRAFT_984330 [Neocallimastix lanati (nom. inval.)]|uniref:Uncharacterized protein n=1 Tax=Neocallimastix californiae TaxID=1754190 RepID=A0A1Y2BTP7_9FUNG|nr:hypothetical protein H8356DRAFT_984330 [Neocallimastix sp. JGI-2020a]ORY38074.1 hypothetical protein LY90DRAFT_510982 [Neocallimastix californiae]|eukprot:ORY38074.1 hypothetical protein LY90DRAFT_510982 [Neocallimastix californiae]